MCKQTDCKVSLRQFEESPEEVAAWKAKKEPLVSNRGLTATALLRTCATAKRTRDSQGRTKTSTNFKLRCDIDKILTVILFRNIFLKGLHIVRYPNRCFIRVQLDDWLSYLSFGHPNVHPIKQGERIMMC